MRALCVVGARPNFMKIKPVMDVLEHGVVARRPALWDGMAGERIAEVLLDKERPRR